MAEVDLADVHHALRSLEGLGCHVVRNDNGQRVDLDETMWLVANVLAGLARARAATAQLRIMEIGGSPARPTLVVGEVASHWTHQADQITTFMFDTQLPRPKWMTFRAEETATTDRWNF